MKTSSLAPLPTLPAHPAARDQVSPPAPTADRPSAGSGGIPVSPLDGRRALWGGVILILSVVQYFLAQLLAASAWTTGYNWSTNVISDLGNTACGQFSVHVPTTFVCSPLHAVMNASFIVTGVLTILGTLLLWRVLPRRRLTTIGLALWLVAGLGKMIVGLVPENASAALHMVGAANLTIGSIAILLLSIAVRREHTGLARFGRIVSIIGYVAGGLFITAQYAGPAWTLGLGIGGIERLAGYPSNLWVLAVGVLVVLGARKR